MEMFPDLENYSNCWPVTDLIMIHLKYTSSHAQRHEVEFVAGKAKWVPILVSSYHPLFTSAHSGTEVSAVAGVEAHPCTISLHTCTVW